MRYIRIHQQLGKLRFAAIISVCALMALTSLIVLIPSYTFPTLDYTIYVDPRTGWGWCEGKSLGIRLLYVDSQGGRASERVSMGGIPDLFPKCEMTPNGTLYSPSLWSYAECDVPDWTHVSDNSDNSHDFMNTQATHWKEVEYGWPRPVLCCITIYASGKGYINLYEHNITPRILWIGLVMNMVCYIVPSWLLINSYVRIQAMYRIRRGHCRVCNYDMRFIEDRGCPECGWNRKDNLKEDDVQ